jgi:hypothetical protein
MIMRTVGVDQKLIGFGAGVALGAGLVWGILTLLVGSPLGFLVIPLGGAVGYLLAKHTIERSTRLLGLAMALTVLVFLFSKMISAQFVGEGLLAGQVAEDPTCLTQRVFADELRTMVGERRASPRFSKWLEDTSQTPSEDIQTGLEEYLVLAEKRFHQRPKKEQEAICLKHAKEILLEGGFLGRLGYFLGFMDLVWLAIALALAAWFASGGLDTEIVHQTEEVPEGDLAKFDDLEIFSA